jgi:mRNA-degrading endonuclease toxin of MazEF toxin-antitoxin module
MNIRFASGAGSVGRTGFVVVNQIGTVDVERFTKRLGRLSPVTRNRSLEVLQAMFAA